MDILQKIAEEAFGMEAQQFTDKAIYAKMPDHVKKILNSAHFEHKPYHTPLGKRNETQWPWSAV